MPPYASLSVLWVLKAHYRSLCILMDFNGFLEVYIVPFAT